MIQPTNFDKIRRRQTTRKHSKILNVYNQKLELYGDEGILTQYNPQIYSWSNPHERTKRTTGEKKQSNINYAKKQLYQLAKCNVNAYPHKTIFLTLTFDPKKVSDIQEKQKALPYLQHMFRKLKRHGYAPKYLGITENQKNGNIHFHLLVFNLPYLSIEQWQNYWSHGFIDIKVLKTVKNVSAYFTKYMQKDFINDNQLNEKLFFTSRNLIRPKTLYKNSDIDYIVNDVSKKQLYSEMKTVGNVSIKKYKLSLTT